MHIFWPVLWLLCGLVFILFSFVIAFGAPFLPILTKQVSNALDLLDLQPGQTLLELGSGDGRILIAAAERGITAIGYELNPLLVIFSWLRTRRYGRKVRIIWGNYWKKAWPPTDGIFVFLLNPYMTKLDKKIIQLKHRPIKLVSFAFQIEGKVVTKRDNGMYLYLYS